ncbi:hypothetical protein CMO92_03410 [Candidatus Woesearchaeota archaeon]|nr:hypothetical protein [Candidatus Woesearchaeota archaeon]|tara:strand:+ start:1030 stop:1425 length:396 start_codon:yes stop_codon:yes gene_type:complete
MLNTKSILAPKKESDGRRISVMSRHTLNDGVTPHPQITRESYDEWNKLLSPPSKLLGDYYKRGLPWKQFEQRYREHLTQPNCQAEIQNLAQRSLDSVITLLCIESSPEYCHRRLLAEECKKYQPTLILNIM